SSFLLSFLDFPAGYPGALIGARRLDIPGRSLDRPTVPSYAGAVCPPPMGALGALETEVMDAVWREDRELRVRDIHMCLQARLAYTAVQNTIDPLLKKGQLRL